MGKIPLVVLSVTPAYTVAMNDSKNGCMFCMISEDRILLENSLAFAIWDGFPVTSLHALIIPRRHAPTYFDLERDEIVACNELMQDMKKRIQNLDTSVEGFNIGVNIGATAGQTIFHCHIHMIPRRAGDVSNPAGGVRHLIPGRGHYGQNQ